MQDLIQKALEHSRNYADYRQYLTDLLAEGKTTGPNQSEFYIKIATLNQSRMKRLDKRTKLIPDLANLMSELKNAYQLLVLTEGWCGDAAQIVPVLQKMAEASTKIDLQFIFRDEHLDLMDLFKTDGGRSIPKMLVLNPDTKEVLMDWGPRPAFPQKMSMDYKYQAEPKPDYETHHMELHSWYTKDKTLSTQGELYTLFNTLEYH